MTRPGPGATLRVFADLDVSVTAPDGSATQIRVRDKDGEVLVDVDEPLTVLRALPSRSDLRALASYARNRMSTDNPVSGSWPPVRIRTRGYTLAVARPGRARPGGVVAAAAVVAVAGVAGVAALVAVAVRQLVRHGRRQ